MPGLKWATDDELTYLTTKVDGFNEIHSEGKARVKNLRKTAYLQEVYDEYEHLFPGRIASMDLPRVGTGGTAAERSNVMIEVGGLKS